MKVIDSKKSQRNAIVRVVEACDINLSIFDLAQIIAGADLYFTYCFNDRDKAILNYIYRTYTQLTVEFHNLTQVSIDDQVKGADFEINRNQLVIILDWLELKIDHCKKEREDDSEKFNLETYIGQRELRLELKELLQVAIVSENEE